jgi:hypothetical protein
LRLLVNRRPPSRGGRTVAVWTISGQAGAALVTNDWRLDDVVPAAEVIRRIDAELPLEPAAPNHRGEVARR